ncbi:hypothetical protein ACIGXM_14655 [Kitasatospora sp. NPDC052896]|uniref:hypothetical protein n=1 Tax=Kitasatospora sp. NPDC052896 TaxID=3364061 RepID=UPI0037CAFD95
MGEDPAWVRPLLYSRSCCWDHAQRWKCMVGRMYPDPQTDEMRQVGLVELCVVKDQKVGPLLLWSGRATDVPQQ